MNSSPCACCKQLGTYVCKICNAITYCSPTCAADDRSMHSNFCSTYATFLAENPRPASTASAHYLLAVHIRRKKVKVEFFWRKIDVTDTANRLLFNELDDSLLQNKATVYTLISCLRKAGCEEKHGVKLFWLQECMDGDFKANKSVSYMLGNSNHSWKGPLVALGMRAVEETQKFRHKDISMLDMHVLAAFFEGDGAGKQQVKVMQKREDGLWY